MSDGSNELNGMLKKIKKASSKLLESLLARYFPEVESYYQNTISSKINQNSSKNKERIVGLNTYGLMCKTGHSFLQINA